MTCESQFCVNKKEKGKGKKKKKSVVFLYAGYPKLVNLVENHIPVGKEGEIFQR